MSPSSTARGHTPNELARILRVSPDRIREWIASGELRAIDTAPPRSRRPRYIILPEHLEAFTRRHQVSSPAPAPARKRRRPPRRDYYPD